MSIPSDISTADLLAARLSVLGVHVRRLALLRGLGWVLLIPAIGIALGMFIDLMWEIGTTTRMVLLAVSCLGAVAVAAVCLARTFISRPSPAELAALVERAHPEVGEQLSSVVELNDPKVPDEHKGSPLMRDLLMGQTLKTIGPIDFQKSVSSRRARRSAFCGTAAWFALLLPFVVSPGDYGLLWSRFLKPWGNFDRASNLFFEVVEGDRVVARGSDVLIEALPGWRYHEGDLPKSVQLNWIDSSGQTDARRMALNEAENLFAATIPQVFHSFEFNVSAAGGRSRNYRVDVVDAPEVRAVTLDVQPPAYTGYPAQHIDGVVGEMTVFEHSLLSFEMKFNKPIYDVALQWLDGQASSDETATAQSEQRSENNTQVAVAQDRLSATLETTAVRGGQFALRLTDEAGLNNLNEPRRVLRIERDQPPQLSLDPAGEPQRVRPNGAVRVTARASDDFGVGALELHYQLPQGKTGVLSLEAAQLGDANVEGTFDLDAASLGLDEKQMLTYRVRAADQRPIPGPNEVWSEQRSLVVDSTASASGSENLAERQSDLKGQLEQIREDVANSREQLEQLNQQAATAQTKKAPFEQSEALAPLSEQQLETAQKLEQLANQFTANALFTHLGPVARDVARSDLVEAAEKARRAEKRPIEETAKLMAESTAHLAAADQKLKQLAEELEELAELERDLHELSRLARRTERLANKAHDLERRSREPSKDKSSKQEQARNEKLDQERQNLEEQENALAESLDSLLDRRPEILAAARKRLREELAELSRRATDLVEPQQELARAVEKNPPLDDAKSDAGAPKSDGQKTDDQKSNDRAQSTRSKNSEADPAEATESSSAQATQQRQRQLTGASTRLAIDVARSLGPESSAAKAATESARQAEQAHKLSQTGQLREAAIASRQSAQSLEKVAAELADGGQPTADLQSRAEALKQRQDEVVANLEKHADSPQARAEAQQAGQRRLAKATDALSEAISDIGGRLAAHPVNLPEPAQKAIQSAERAGNAHEQMNRADDKIGQGESTAAAQHGKQAAENLRQAAELAAQAAGDENQPDSPVPGSLAEQVAEAARRLEAAREQLAKAEERAQAGKDQPNQQSGNGESKEGSPKPGDGNQKQKGAAQPGGKKQSSPSPLAKSADDLDRAADALSQAAQQLEPGQQADASGQSKLDFDNLPPDMRRNETPGGEGGKKMSGGEGEIDIDDLEREFDRLSKREWGQLPRNLRTEILQSAGAKPDSEYARLIKLYFREIATESTTRQRRSGRKK